MSYQIPDLKGCDLELSLAVKNSHFIANLRHAHGRAACDIHLNDLRKKYPDANHHCWAVVADAPDNSTFWGLSDAGEPSGTAGKPMLQVLSHCGLGEVSVVVCRYFGGTKLGTGGLVKAYTDAVKLVVEACPRQTKRELKQIKITLAYDHSGRVEHLSQKYEGVIDERIYTDQLTLLITLPTQHIKALAADIGSLADTYIEAD